MPSPSSRSRGRRTISEINMVPFIDVMLVLLIPHDHPQHGRFAQCGQSRQTA